MRLYALWGRGSSVYQAAFAMMEAKVVLATLAQRYRFFLEMGHRVQGDAVITYRPLHGMKMTVHRRG